MSFLAQVEKVDRELNPRRAKKDKPMWLSMYNFVGLLRACEHFVDFRHVRNLYEGGMIGEGMVKELRPRVACGMNINWATNVIVSHYRSCSLDHIIDAVETEGGQVATRNRVCPLGELIETTKFKRFSNRQKVETEIALGNPLSVLMYHNENKKLLVICLVLVQGKTWSLLPVRIHANPPTCHKFGLVFHEISLASRPVVMATDKHPAPKPSKLGTKHLPFLTYGLMLPYYRKNKEHFRYSLLRADNWAHYDKKHKWNLSGF
jgi:hypothetical protein